MVSLGGERAVEGFESAELDVEGAAERLGVALAERLLAEGASSILADVRAAAIPSVPEP